MSNLKLILKQSLNMVITWFVGVFIGFLSNIVFTRYLTQQEFGNFTLTRSTIALIAFLCMFGLNQGLLRQGSIALGQGKKPVFDQIRNYTLSYTFIIGIVACVIIFFGAGFIAGFAPC